MTAWKRWARIHCYAVSLYCPEGYDLLQTAGIGKFMANSPIEL